MSCQNECPRYLAFLELLHLPNYFRGVLDIACRVAEWIRAICRGGKEQCPLLTPCPVPISVHMHLLVRIGYSMLYSRAFFPFRRLQFIGALVPAIFYVLQFVSRLRLRTFDEVHGVCSRMGCLPVFPGWSPMCCD